MSLPPGVILLTRLLTEEPIPTDFDISILRADDDGTDAYPQIVKQDGHLAIHAGDLPKLAREFRTCYEAHRQEQNCLQVTTACLLLVCPDHATAWDDRKRYLASQESMELLYKELEFLNLLMTRHSKSPNSWIHRKWLVRRLFRAKETVLMDLVQNEIQLCVSVATKFPKNYYAWTHRIFILDNMVVSFKGTPADAEMQMADISSVQAKNLLRSELETIEPWSRRHVSDHSAVHYGGHVLRLLMYLEQNTAMDIAQGALESARRLVELYPTHETLWIWRRLCGHAVLHAVMNEIEADQSTRDKAESAVLQRFVKIEIIELLDSAKEAQESQTVGEARLEEDQTQRYRLSYMIWIMEQVKRCNFTGWILPQLRDDVLALLAKQDFPYNVWRQPQAASLFAK